MSFADRIAPWCRRVDAQLEQLLADCGTALRLQEAMRYSTFNGGKRLRPVLVYAANQALKGDPANADAPACAVECIHAYSLIHDDLPAMDDDELRRGKPTCHIAFDEATAILAGDALQALAFETLTQPIGKISAQTRLAMLAALAQASGDKGMVAGQAIDTHAVGKPLTLPQLEQMHALKTGALIRASVRLGALSADASEPQFEALDAYAAAIGLAFQVHDDILDIEGNTEILGKQQGADSALNKPTFPALLGLDQAKQKARDLHRQAIDTLAPFGDDAALLRGLANYIIERDH